jgi:histidinol-phosphate aminotransferase
MAITRRKLLVQLAGATAVGISITPKVVKSQPNGQPQVVGHATKYICLDHNENAYGASAQAVARLRESADEANLYPTGEDVLIEALAKYHGVNSRRVVLGCGSSEVLRMAATAFLQPRHQIILSTPTFDLIRKYAEARGAHVVQVPLRKNYSHDMSGILAHARRNAGGLIYICNPNNPTGTLTERKEVEAFLTNLPSTYHVVIDEAYHHYAVGSGAYASFIERPADNPRVIVTRTFSIAYGLAGLRVGYAVTSEEVARQLKGDSLPFGINRLGVAAALAALEDQQHVESCVAKNEDGRQEFFNQVNARMLRAVGFHANFVCLNVMRQAIDIIEHYRKNGCLLPPPIPGMPNYVRVSLGTPEEMHEFWRIWDALGPHPMKM